MSYHCAYLKENEIKVTMTPGGASSSSIVHDETLIGTGTNENPLRVDTTIIAQKNDIPAPVTEETVSNWGFTKNIGNYNKPQTGIPKTDLESDVQTSLEKANTALQEHQDITGKVDKIEGKGLSTNDFTNEEKAKLSNLENYDDTQVKSDIDVINEKIPTQATNINQLADKDFVNSSLNSITAFYVTKNADGDQFNSKSELDNATEFYSGGEVRVPTRNDYCIVLEDETKDNSTTRYIYQNEQWEFQYIVNETPLTSEQVKAINSGITLELVSKLQGIDLTDYVKNTDYATSLKGGVIKTDTGLYSTEMVNGKLTCMIKDYETQYPYIDNKSFISKGTLENVIIGKGLVSNTDYATAQKGGTVKANIAGFNVSTSGLPSANVYSYANYLITGDGSFIGKGTLENIKPYYVKEGLIDNPITLTDEEKLKIKTWLGISEHVTLTQAEYDALVEVGTVDENTYYYIKEE